MGIKRQEQVAGVIGCNPEDGGSTGGELIRGWAGITAEVQKSRVQLWRDIRAGRFPAPIETGPNSIAWFRLEIEAWKASRPRRTYSAAAAA
jgi:predicted DNA-binding transcriptional regulator AlpA